MQSPASALVDYLGIGELSFDLEPSQRRALLIISALPAILVIAALTQLSYEIDLWTSDDPLFGGAFSYNESRVYRLAVVVQTPAAYVGLAVMMIAGIGRITRSAGSYCLVGAMVFAGTAILCGIYASMVFALVDQYTPARDWYGHIALSFASLAGLVAAGYGFLAFRGLAPRAAE